MEYNKRFEKRIYNIGFLGIGKFKATNKSIIYNTWFNMIKRCYSDNEQKIKNYYIGCIVCDEWHNLQIFGEWFENNYILGFALDKDIMLKGNKIYSPETCCFVPLQINQLFTKSDKIRGELPIGLHYNKSKKITVQIKKYGKQVYLGSFDSIEKAFNIYKINKEFYIKQVANIWKNKITEKVYESLINYNVEITD